MFCKRLTVTLLFCFAIILGMNGNACATDVYACDFEGHEVYVDTGLIMGSPYQIVVANGVKFVKSGKQTHFATAKFYLEGRTWWGNVFIDNIPSSGDYPVAADPLTSAIFDVARRYV